MAPLQSHALLGSYSQPAQMLVLSHATLPACLLEGQYGWLTGATALPVNDESKRLLGAVEKHGMGVR